jgi:hypothetical protein
MVALAVFLECYTPRQALPGELPPLSRMVNDFPSWLKPAYVKELEMRLRRFNQESGYAIVVVIIESGENEQISQLISQLFASNSLEQWGVEGTVLVLITAEEGWVIAEPSQGIEQKFLRPGALAKIHHIDDGSDRRELAVERRIHAVLEILDPWLYVLKPPATNPELLFARFPTAEMIVFPLAPFLGFMAGVMLMAFTAAGELPAFNRFLVCGCVGSVVAVLAAFLVRQPGGIAPGMLYYSAVVSFVVSVLIGTLRPYWFSDKVRGRRPGEKIHAPFFGKG